MNRKKHVALWSMALFAFGVGTTLAVSALPPNNCNNCYANYNHCITTTPDHDYCERQLIACEAYCGP